MIKHVIVQAGGKGTRMGKLTENKPKCLISVNGITILQTISIAFPDAILHIIGDYKIDILQSYLEVLNPDFKYDIIKAEGKGTNAGISKALEFVPNGNSFAITWADLFYLSPILELDENRNYIGLTNSNRCRYSFEEGKFTERDTNSNGVIGMFIFKNKSFLSALPSDGEFVRFLSRSNIEFFPLLVNSVREIGTFDSYLSFKSQFPVSRFFNNIEVEDDEITKRASDPKFKHLLEDEINWYHYMENSGFTGIPKIRSFEPLKLERIMGVHPHQIKGLSQKDKTILVKNIIKRLEEVHSIATFPVRSDDLYKVYVDKTLDRIRPVTRMLKLNSKKTFIINGRKIEALNPDEPSVVISLYNKLSSIQSFCPIHGDPTFSNTLVMSDKEIKFIDPRGTFGNSKIFGDPRYDFAKLYYSTVGNYDQFNSQNFEVRFQGEEITIKIESSGFEDSWSLFNNSNVNFVRDIEIIHSLIWLSLSGYFINDVDSMIGSYFHGLELLSEMIEKYGS